MSAHQDGDRDPHLVPNDNLPLFLEWEETKCDISCDLRQSYHAIERAAKGRALKKLDSDRLHDYKEKGVDKEYLARFPKVDYKDLLANVNLKAISNNAQYRNANYATVHRSTIMLAWAR